MGKGPFTPSKSGSESEKDQGINDKHQRKYSLSRSLSLNTALNYRQEKKFMLIKSLVMMAFLRQKDCWNLD